MKRFFLSLSQKCNSIFDGNILSRKITEIPGGWGLKTKVPSVWRGGGEGGEMSIFGNYTIEPQHIYHPLSKEQERSVSWIVVVQMPSVTYHTP